MKDLSDHTAVPCELLTASLIRRLQLCELSKVLWLLGLVKHDHMGGFLVFLHLPLFPISKILASSRLPYDPLHRHVDVILIFLEDPF
jgi:hypothetical protein